MENNINDLKMSDLTAFTGLPLHLKNRCGKVMLVGSD